MEGYIDVEKNVLIDAHTVKIGKNVTFGSNISITLRGDLEIGNYSHVGDDVDIKGNNIRIGKHFYHSKGLRVGGGGHGGPNANLEIGDRCTLHNNFINICEPVVIGDDVGLSEDVSILTHGFWQSVLWGYPRKFAGVTIKDGAIVGYRSTILPGVKIGENCVIGANSNVTKNLKKNRVYGGNPAKFINWITMPDIIDQESKAREIVSQYPYSNPGEVEFDFPHVCFLGLWMNLLTFKYKGTENEATDHFRDYLRKWGIRIYTERPFS